MTKTKANEANSLLSLYEALYKEKYKKSPSLNRYKERWAMIDVLDDLGPDEAAKILTYYFSTGKSGHPLQFFFYNYEKIKAAYQERERDKERFTRLLAETKERVDSST